MRFEPSAKEWLLSGTPMELTKREYTVIYEKGKRNWSAYVPDLPGCIATAKTQKQLERVIREAIEFHIEGLLLHGEAHSNQPWEQARFGLSCNDRTCLGLNQRHTNSNQHRRDVDPRRDADSWRSNHGVAGIAQKGPELCVKVRSRDGLTPANSCHRHAIYPFLAVLRTSASCCGVTIAKSGAKRRSESAAGDMSVASFSIRFSHVTRYFAFEWMARLKT